MENFQNRSGTLEDYLYKDESNNISKVVNQDKKGAKYAKLDYELMGYKYDKTEYSSKDNSVCGVVATGICRSLCTKGPYLHNYGRRH